MIVVNMLTIIALSALLFLNLPENCYLMILEDAYPTYLESELFKALLGALYILSM